jgi:hypothetical protein
MSVHGLFARRVRNRDRAIQTSRSASIRVLAIVNAGLLIMAGCSSSSDADPADVAVALVTLQSDSEGMFTGGLRWDLGWSAHDVYVSPDGACAAVALTLEESADGVLMVLASVEQHSVLDIYGDQYPDSPEFLDEVEEVLDGFGWIPTSLNAQRLDDVNVGGYRVGLVTFGPKCDEEYHLDEVPPVQKGDVVGEMTEWYTLAKLPVPSEAEILASADESCTGFREDGVARWTALTNAYNSNPNGTDAEAHFEALAIAATEYCPEAVSSFVEFSATS